MAGYTTRLLIFALDVCFALFSFYFAILLTHNFNGKSTALFFSIATPLLIVLRVLAFKFFRTYAIIIRYVGEKDYISAVAAVTSSSLLFFAVARLVPGVLPENYIGAIVLTDFFVLLMLSTGLRIGLRVVYDYLRLRRSSSLNTAIFGAGELGALTLRMLQHNTSHNYQVNAFFDDNPKVHRKFLNGIRIFNPRKSFGEVIKKYDIKVAIIGINVLSEERRIEFIDACLVHKVKVLKLPPVSSWINGQLNLSHFRDINFEDLLNRPPIKLDEESIMESVDDKVILVTGCAGSIGSEIVRQLLRFRPRLVVGLDQAETPLAEISLALQDQVNGKRFHTIIGDIKDYDKLHRIFETYQPDYVFHAAAYKHVPIMERFPEEAIKANVLGTKNLADISIEYQVEKFVMISTDKVVNPGNVMGASKRIAEIYVQSLNFWGPNGTQFITTRFGNVLGSNGSVIPIFKAQIEARQPVTVTDPDVTRFFMTIPEACQLVLEAGAMGKGGEIFIFDMGEPVRIADLARKMIQMAGLTPDLDIKIVYTGLRPGEKLYEELLDGQEGHLPTHHPKIRKAAVRPCDYGAIQPAIEALIRDAKCGTASRELVARMKKLVPEFSSQNSVFSALDKR